MYSLIRQILFTLPPESAHHLVLKSLATSHKLGLTDLLFKQMQKPVNLMGLTFPNPVGLCPGFDSNGDYIDALAALGFGFIEIGGVTPKAQSGNPSPRIFRLVKEEALINRMGFANKGVEHVATNLKNTKYRGILGINIGKNKETPLENAASDYLFCFRSLAEYASYFTINISSPNSPGLRELQKPALLNELLAVMKKEQALFFGQQKKYIPLVVKLSPDLSEKELADIAEVLLQQKIDGVVATNTTISRTNVENAENANEAGGLSGRPLLALSTKIISQLNSLLKNRIPIIASGGVIDEKAAKEKFAAGASLVQIYTGFIYRGPGLIKKIIKEN